MVCVGSESATVTLVSLEPKAHPAHLPTFPFASPHPLGKTAGLSGEMGKATVAGGLAEGSSEAPRECLSPFSRAETNHWPTH